MVRTLLSVVALTGLVTGAFAQPPEPVPQSASPPPVPVPLVSTPPTDAVPNSPPDVTVVTTVVKPTEPRRFLLGGEVGPIIATWRNGTLRPSELFAVRSPLFPIPNAKYDPDIDHNTSIAARVFAGYTFEHLPLTASVGWETYHRRAETVLLGYDPLAAGYLHGLNDYNAQQREHDVPGRWPWLQLRGLPSEAHELRSRTAVNVADATLAWKVWTPRETNGVEYRVLAGGRFGGFYFDDLAFGSGYEQSASSWYSGGGPQGGLRIDYAPLNLDKVRTHNLWLDVRGGALFGEVTQRFREVDTVWGGNTPYRELAQRGNRTVPFLSTEAGWGLGGPAVRLSVVVRYSQYWGVANVGPSSGDFGVVAGFLRLEAGF
jgi:hypothetical protein